MSPDVAVIGAGPAGSTVARLLARWGYSVVIITRESRRPSLAETIPPSTNRLFRLLEIDNQFGYRTTGTTSWWGSDEARVESYPEPGCQVVRSEFDGALLDLAVQSGVIVREGSVRSGAEVRARFLLDCSGRNGVLARQGLRINEPGHRTVAICGIWTGSWPMVDSTHTLIESYEDGWAWSVPVSPKRRFVAFMVDQASGLFATYRAKLAKTRMLRSMLDGSFLEHQPWACDASLYHASTYSGPEFLLIGDAGSAVDPLSSFGVKKAMSSAWLGAVVVNTCLRRPEMASIALDYFNTRERQVYADHLRQTTAHFREIAVRQPHPFWTGRSEGSEQAEIASALEDLRRSPEINLRRHGLIGVGRAPQIRGREIVLEEKLVIPGLPSGLEYLLGVHLPKLVAISEQHTQIPDLFEAYNRVAEPVALPNFLSALSVLLAKRVLRNDVGR